MNPRNRLLPRGLSRLRALQTRSNPSTVNLSLGKPAISWPKEVLGLATSVLESDSLEYTENAGDCGVRQKLAIALRARDHSQLILTHGAQEGLMACLMAGLNATDEVLIPDPGFLAYAPMVKMLGGRAIPYGFKRSGDTFEHSAESILEKVTSRTRFVILNSPGNPTGVGLSDECLEQLLKGIGKRKVLILSDEVYGALQFYGTYKPLFLKSERIVTVNAFSKSHALTGWRIGYIASQNQEFLGSALVAHQYIATCASVPAQRLLGRLLDSPLFSQLPAKFAAEYQRNCERFVEGMPKSFRQGLGFPSGGFYLFPRAPGGDGDLFCEELLKKENVLVTPGSAFGKKGKGHIRLSLAIAPEKLEQAMEKMKVYY